MADVSLLITANQSNDGTTLVISDNSSWDNVIPSTSDIRKAEMKIYVPDNNYNYTEYDCIDLDFESGVTDPHTEISWSINKITGFKEESTVFPDKIYKIVYIITSVFNEEYSETFNILTMYNYEYYFYNQLKNFPYTFPNGYVFNDNVKSVMLHSVFHDCLKISGEIGLLQQCKDVLEICENFIEE